MSKFDQVLDICRAITILLTCGAQGMDSNLGEVPLVRGPRLRTMLEYPNETRMHEKYLQEILGQVNRGDDTVREPKDPNRSWIWRVPGHITMKYDKIVKTRLDVSFMYSRADNDSNGIWSFGYFCFVGPDEHKFRIGTVGFQVEKNLSLQFIFSPKPLDIDSVCNQISFGSKIVNDNLFKFNVFEWSGYRHFQYIFDGQNIARNGRELGVHENEIAYLRDRGNFKFSIVEIGTALVGGKKHWIYTGSERLEKIK